MSTKRFPKKLKWILTRLGLSVLFSPFIIYTYGVLSPSTAYATTPGEEVTDSQTSPESSQDASQEVVQEDPSPELTQSSLDEVSTAVATAESDLTTTEQTLQEVVLDEEKVTNQETQTALSEASDAVASADSALEQTNVAVADAQQKITDWSDAQDAVEAQEQEVTTKEVALAEAQTALSEATPDYEESVTVTENFNDGTLDGVDVSVVGGSSVSSTTQNGITMYNWGESTDGISLKMYYPSSDLLIDPTTDYNVYEFGFEVYALNGNSEAVVTFVSDSDVETTMFDTSYVIPDSVANNQVNSYKKTVTYTAPSGYSIDKVVVKATNDWFGIDNIFWSYYNIVFDPSYQAAVDDAETNLASAQSTLSEYQEVSAVKQSSATEAVSLAESLLSTAQSLISIAQEKVSTAESLVSGLVAEANKPKPQPTKSEVSVQPVVLVTPEPAPVVVALEPEPEKEIQESPEPQQDTEEEVPEEPKVQSPQLPSLDSTTEEKVEFLVESLEEGESLDLDEILELGVELEDLPEETPISVRTDSSGNAVVITAKDAVAIEMVSDPQKLAAALVTDPGAVVEALSSVGKDMTEEEREESQEVVVASVVVANVANLASNAAAAGGAVAYRRKP